LRRWRRHGLRPGRRLRLRRVLRWRCRRSGLALAVGRCLAEHEHDLPDLHLVARLDPDLRHGAALAGRHFDRRLVGFQLENGLILLHDVADLDHHADDIALLDVLAKLRQFELDGHLRAPQLVNWSTGQPVNRSTNRGTDEPKNQNP